VIDNKMVEESYRETVQMCICSDDRRLPTLRPAPFQD